MSQIRVSLLDLLKKLLFFILDAAVQEMASLYRQIQRLVIPPNF